MKILYSTILLLLLGVTSQAMPLVYKVTKKTAGEIAVIDTSKYDKLRILATASEKDALCSISVAAVEDGFDFMLLRTPSFKPFVLNEMIDAPPAKLKFSADKECTYSLFIYGSI